MVPACGKADLGGHAAHRGLHGIEGRDLPDGGFGDRGFLVARQFHEAAAQMAPAMHQRPRPLVPLDGSKLVIGLIAIALQEAPAIALQEVHGMNTPTPGCVLEQNNRRAGAAMTTVIRSDGPEEPRLGAPPPRIKHWCCGLVHEDAICRRQMLAHVIGDRLKVEAGPPSPVPQGGTVQRDGLARVDVGLTVERHMIAKLRDDHLGDQCLGGKPARHNMFRRMGLHHRA